jgi:hypothetical protein
VILLARAFAELTLTADRGKATGFGEGGFGEGGWGGIPDSSTVTVTGAGDRARRHRGRGRELSLGRAVRAEPRPMAEPIDIGDDVVLHAEFRTKVAGVDTDRPDRQHVHVQGRRPGRRSRRRSAAAASPGSASASTGTFTPTVAGEHWYRGVGTGAAKGAGESVFRSQAPRPVTVDARCWSPLEQRIGRRLTAAEQHIAVEQIDELLNRAKDDLEQAIQDEQAKYARANRRAAGGAGLEVTDGMLAILRRVRKSGHARELELLSMGYLRSPPRTARREAAAHEAARRLRSRRSAPG